MTAKNRKPGTKKVYADERRGWLEDYEGGKSLPILAKETRRNIRTIKKQIEAARDERERALARTDLYRQALIHHNEDLLSTLRAVRDSLVVPPEDRFTTLAHYGEGSGATSGKPLVRVVDGEAHAALVEGEEAERLLALAREHMQRDRETWSKLDEWRKKLEDYAGLCYTLGQQVGEHAVRETGLSFIRVEQGVADGIHFLRHSVIGAVYGVEYFCGQDGIGGHHL